MYSIIIVKTTCGFYTADNPGYFVELRDQSINSACTVGKFNSPEAAQRAAENKAAKTSLELNGEIDYVDNAEKLADAPTIKGPANLSFADLCHWHRRGQEIFGQPVTITVPAEA